MDYVFPPAIQAYGWFIELLPILVTATFMAVVISRRILSDEDASFIKFGVMLTPKSSWGPRSDRFDDEPMDTIEGGGEDNKTFEKECAANEGYSLESNTLKA